jgi:hypothetical protein
MWNYPGAGHTKYDHDPKILNFIGRFLKNKSNYYCPMKIITKSLVVISEASTVAKLMQQL